MLQGVDLERITREIDEPEEERKLFVGGLKSTSTEKHLYETFLKYGHLVDVCVIRGPDFKPRGFGFVSYSKSSMMHECLRDHPDMRISVDGKSVELKRITIKEPRPKKTGPDQSLADQDTNKIFVGGIPETASEQAVFELFSQFGEIESIEIPMKEKEGKPRGFAFVTFVQNECIEGIVSTKYHYLQGKKIEVKRAIAKEKMPNAHLYTKRSKDSAKDGPRDNEGRGGRRGGRGGGRNRGRDRGNFGNDRDRRGGGPGGPGMNMGPDGPMGFGPDGPLGMGPDGPMMMMGPDGPMPMGPDGPMPMGPDGPMPMGMGPDRHMGRGPERPMGPMGRGPDGPRGMGSDGPMGMGPGPDMPMGGRGPMGPGAMDKFDERMFDGMPSDEALRRQFGEGPGDFGERDFPMPGPKDFGGPPRGGGDFPMDRPGGSKDPELAEAKMKEYYRAMYMWKLKWYQMMKAWSSAKASASEGGSSGGGNGGGPLRDAPRGGGYGAGPDPQWGGGGPPGRDNYSGLGSNYGNTSSSFGPMRKDNPYGGGGMGPYGGGGGGGMAGI